MPMPDEIRDYLMENYKINRQMATVIAHHKLFETFVKIYARSVNNA